MTIQRDGRIIQKTAHVNDNGKLGFYPNLNVDKKIRTYSFIESVGVGANRAYNALATNLIGFSKLLTGQLDPQKTMQGPIGIATIYGGDIQWARFWEITGLLSMVIGLVNILPIPALDGGHAILLTYEMIVRRPIPDNVYKVIQTVGVVIILSLMAFVIFNDIIKLAF
jgi:regulator of sigma E protease